MIFGEYFPNAAMFGTGPDAQALVSPLLAAAVEGGCAKFLSGSGGATSGRVR
jgi:hypothetical protein